MAQHNLLTPLMKLVNGDALSALTTPTSHFLHAGRLLTCIKLPIHIHSSSSKINRLASTKGFNIHAEREKGKVMFKSFEYILKIASPKNLSPNVRNEISITRLAIVGILLVHTRLHTNIANACDCEHNN